MLAISLCTDSDPANSCDNGHFRSIRTAHSGHALLEGARPEVVRGYMGQANIDVTQNVYGMNWYLASFREDHRLQARIIHGGEAPMPSRSNLRGQRAGIPVQSTAAWLAEVQALMPARIPPGVALR
jgi:hypothetical protein